MYVISHYPLNVIFLRALAVFFLIAAWLPVFFPSFRFHHKGGNRAPLSRKSMWLFVVTATSWSLVAWGIAPWFFAAVFAASIVCGMVLSRRDRKLEDRKTGIMPRVRMSEEQTWKICSVFVGVLWLVWLLFAVRDYFWPPTGRDAEAVHYLTLGFLGFFTLLAVLLFVGRPKAKPPSNQSADPHLS